MIQKLSKCSSNRFNSKRTGFWVVGWTENPFLKKDSGNTIKKSHKYLHFKVRQEYEKGSFLTNFLIIFSSKKVQRTVSNIFLSNGWSIWNSKLLTQFKPFYEKWRCSCIFLLVLKTSLWWPVVFFYCRGSHSRCRGSFASLSTLSNTHMVRYKSQPHLT